MFNGRTQDYDDTTITNSGFWCDITIDEFQKQRAIPLQIPVEMVKAVLIAAMQGINIDLAEVEENYRKSKINLLFFQTQARHLGKTVRVVIARFCQCV